MVWIIWENARVISGLYYMPALVTDKPAVVTDFKIEWRLKLCRWLCGAYLIIRCEYSQWLVTSLYEGPIKIPSSIYHLAWPYNEPYTLPHLAGRRENMGQRRPLISLKFLPPKWYKSILLTAHWWELVTWLHLDVGRTQEIQSLLDNSLPGIDTHSGRGNIHFDGN